MRKIYENQLLIENQTKLDAMQVRFDLALENGREPSKDEYQNFCDLVDTINDLKKIIEKGLK